MRTTQERLDFQSSGHFLLLSKTKPWRLSQDEQTHHGARFCGPETSWCIGSGTLCTKSYTVPVQYTHLVAQDSSQLARSTYNVEQGRVWPLGHKRSLCLFIYHSSRVCYICHTFWKALRVAVALSSDFLTRHSINSLAGVLSFTQPGVLTKQKFKRFLLPLSLVQVTQSMKQAVLYNMHRLDLLFPWREWPRAPPSHMISCSRDVHLSENNCSPWAKSWHQWRLPDIIA